MGQSISDLMYLLFGQWFQILTEDIQLGFQQVNVRHAATGGLGI